MSGLNKLFRIAVLTIVGFLIPVAILLPIDFAFSEFGAQPDWETLLVRYLPPSIGCSLFFLASAMTSSTPRKIVTFVQSLFLHFVVFIFCVLAFMPIQHVKTSNPQPGPFAWIPFVAVPLLFTALMVIGSIPLATKRKDLNPIASSTPDKYHA
jgi:hypothetical protein